MSKPGQLADNEVYLGNYLLDRLAQLGVRCLYGVPGDFNLTFLDLVVEHPDIEWIGCCNELNAAYAADGYARVKQAQLNQDHEGSQADSKPGQAKSQGGKDKTQGGVRGLGALLTTQGVGELSAINGIAGAYAERVPVLHVVGVASTKLQKSRAVLHHTLGDGLTRVFEEAHSGITCARAFLQGAEDAAAEIDRILLAALTKARPAYLSLPTDLVFIPVDKKRLETPVVPDSVGFENHDVLPTGKKVQDEEKKRLAFVVKEIERLWDGAKDPIVLIDACSIRYGVSHLVRDLVHATKVKFYTTPMGRTAIDEDPANGFGGVYVGEISDAAVKEVVEKSDLVVMVGSLKSDFNTGEFSYPFPQETVIELHSDSTLVQYAHYPDVSFHVLLPALAKALKPKENVSQPPKDVGLSTTVPEGNKDEMVTQKAFWPMMGAKLFKENDIVVTETGTSNFGILGSALPNGATSVAAITWGAIGAATPMTLGALLAAQETSTPRRTILFTGDGSIQLTLQEVATMIRLGLKPILVILNNDGYTIEKLIHGETAPYNDIPSFDWQSMLSFFNAPGPRFKPLPTKSWLAETRGQLEEILANEEFQKADKIQVLEVRMAPLDAPENLVKQGKLSAELNAA
ncbi:thiamine diphosphate-binding protein [Rhodotorula diobovata]|uniref:Thiamine diphosphate-binding protein n=1 Tax=Rhodotorula diobovata TaxID=5288 RepID=A0A5C5G6C3_9BASI|nr:thiamine diphosphate-binding protein [Rhodotorula diobovata]